MRCRGVADRAGGSEIAVAAGSRPPTSTDCSPSGPPRAGHAVLGMPAGSPGMEQGDAKEPYVVILFGDAAYSEFAKL